MPKRNKKIKIDRLLNQTGLGLMSLVQINKMKVLINSKNKYLLPNKLV